MLYDSSGNTVYTPGFAQRANGADRFFHTDWMGSTRYLSDSSGNTFPSGLRYSAFGQRSATGGSDPFDPSEFQFAGALGYQTEYASGTEPGLGLDYLEQRYYDPATGRFISADPALFAGGLNLYSYAGGDPVGAANPLGLEPVPGTKLPTGDPNGIEYAPDSRGAPPRDADGRPIELHHRGQNPDGPIDEMRREQHRGKGHHGKNHPVRKDSGVDHGPAWDAWREAYWQREWDSGRFIGLPTWQPYLRLRPLPPPLDWRSVARRSPPVHAPPFQPPVLPPIAPGANIVGPVPVFPPVSVPVVPEFVPVLP